MNELTLEWLEAGRNHTYKIYEQQPSKNPGTVRIGRDPSQCDIVLSNPTVSGLHIEVLFHTQRRSFYLRNLRIGNPPMVDGQRLQVEEIELQLLNTIHLGEMQLKVVAISIDVAPTLVSPHRVYPTFEEQHQSNQRENQQVSLPTAGFKSHPQNHANSRINAKTASTNVLKIIVSGAVTYGVVKVLGPLLPLALTILFWRAPVFFSDLQRQQIALKVSGVFFAIELVLIELVLSFFFGWGWAS